MLNYSHTTNIGLEFKSETLYTCNLSVQIGWHRIHDKRSFDSNALTPGHLPFYIPARYNNSAEQGTYIYGITAADWNISVSRSSLPPKIKGKISFTMVAAKVYIFLSKIAPNMAPFCWDELFPRSHAMLNVSLDTTIIPHPRQNLISKVECQQLKMHRIIPIHTLLMIQTAIHPTHVIDIPLAFELSNSLQRYISHRELNAAYVLPLTHDSVFTPDLTLIAARQAMAQIQSTVTTLLQSSNAQHNSLVEVEHVVNKQAQIITQIIEQQKDLFTALGDLQHTMNRLVHTQLNDSNSESSVDSSISETVLKELMGLHYTFQDEPLRLNDTPDDISVSYDTPSTSDSSIVGDELSVVPTLSTTTRCHIPRKRNNSHVPSDS